MKSRVVVLVLCFSLAFIAILARLFYIQVLPQQALERLRKTQYTTMIPLPSQRGKILDRRGEELATSVPAESLYADPGMIQSPKKLAKKLASFLNMAPSEVRALLTEPRRFVWLKRRLDPDVATEIKGWDEKGLKFIEESRRAYPNQTLLSQVLGFVGADGQGLEGLEKKYDADLRGEKESVLLKRDARGRPLVVNDQLFQLQDDGETIETTIDKDLQYELEQELRQVTDEERADRATGMIMNPATGEVLAMASYPSYDLGDATSAHRSDPENRRNRAVTDIFEPGSTFKAVTVAAALRTGRIQPNSKYFCENGKLQIGKHVIHEAESLHGFGWLSVAEILQVSSNIGSTKIAFDVGRDDFKKMMEAFGFGTKTGIDFPGEASGLVVPGNWPDHLFSNISFGHGIGVTALQMVRAYSAIANGGRLMEPYVVQKILDSEQNVLEERRPVMVRQVLTPKEASTVTLMLSGVTQEGGTGTLARVDGYPVAGKTGTAQKVNPTGLGYLPHSYVSSFLGFVPANNPQFTIYVVVDNPKKQHMGAQVAAPVFNHLASFALHQKGFLPITMIAEKTNKVSPTSGQRETKRETPQEEMANKAVVASDLSEAKSEPAASTDLIPDFTGLTVREVSQWLRSHQLGGVRPQVADVHQQADGLRLRALLVGAGRAQSQWPAPGQPLGAVASGQKMKVFFKVQE